MPHLGIEDAAKTYLPLGHLLVAESREASGVTLVKPFCQPSEFLPVMGEKHRCPPNLQGWRKNKKCGRL
jgi:hypothetical protein